jgi:hypothetical protein
MTITTHRKHDDELHGAIFKNDRKTSEACQGRLSFDPLAPGEN